MSGKSVPAHEGEKWPVLRMAKVAARSKAAMARAFAAREADVTPEQWLVLRCLFRKGGVYQQQLAGSLGKDRHSMSRIVQRLEKKGHIERKFDKGDGRLFNVYLTASGRALARKLEPVTAEVLDGALKGLDAEGLAKLNAVLDEIENNLADYLS